MSADVEVRPVGPDEIADLGELFSTARTTRHCWCMSSCSTRAQFAAGWFGGGNRRRFAAMAGRGTPMGVLASVASIPVGWAACGPRSRYRDAGGSPHPLLAGRPRAEDDTVWLLTCLFVHAEHRSQGVSHALVEAAVALARLSAAVAIEAWPLATSSRRSADAFVGREQLFAELGFRPVGHPRPDRTIMRLDLS